MQNIYIVNASTLLKDTDVFPKIAALQKQVDRDFMPHWQRRVVHPVKLHFARMRDISALPENGWPIFLNRHSKDPGALGWHDDDPSQNIRTYSRVFVGDCIRYGLDWSVTLSHELLEMILDPNIHRVWRMPNGEFAALEACDPVEDDSLGYDIDGHRVSDFVLPAYFSTGGGPYDFKEELDGPCPALTPGGYQSITVNGQWTQVSADEADHIPSARALGSGHRRMSRGRLLSDEVEVYSP